MVPDIIDGISIKLNDIYDVPIYGDEDIKQGFKQPCFFIAVLNPSQETRLYGRYIRRNPFDVHYFPKSRIDAENVASELYEALEHITLIDGTLLRGTEISHDVQDGVLHFFVSYNVMLTKDLIPPDSEMDGVIVQTGIGE